MISVKITQLKTKKLIKKYNQFRVFDNKQRFRRCHKFRYKKSFGKNISIMMADQSDDIKDLLAYNKLMQDENMMQFWVKIFKKS